MVVKENMVVKEKKLHKNTVENNADVLNSIINAKIETIQEEINECNSKIEEEIVNLGHAIYETIDWGEYEKGRGIYALSEKTVPIIEEIFKIIRNYKDEIKNYEKKIEEIKNINNILN